MSQSKAVALFAVFLSILLFAGCGGGNDETTGSTSGVAAAAGSAKSDGGEGASGASNPQRSEGTKANSVGGEGGAGNESNAGEAASGGSGGGGKPQSAPAQSGPTGSGAKQQLVAEADNVCRKWGNQIRADATKGYSGDLNGSKKEIREGVDSLARGVEKYVVGDLESEQREVRSLNASAPDAQEAREAAVSALQTLINLGKSDPEALILGSSPASKEAAAMTKAQGFTGCGSLSGEELT